MALKLAALAALAAGTLVATYFPNGPISKAEAAVFVRCSANLVTAVATNSGAWGTQERTKRQSMQSWSALAAQSAGPYYADWNRALGANVDCKRQLFKVTCIATATPCRS